MERQLSDITAIEFEEVVKSIFPNPFDNNSIWSFNHDCNAKVIQYNSLNGTYEFLLRYSDNTFRFRYFEMGKELEITPGEHNAIEIQLKQLGFNISKA